MVRCLDESAHGATSPNKKLTQWEEEQSTTAEASDVDALTQFFEPLARLEEATTPSCWWLDRTERISQDWWLFSLFVSGACRLCTFRRLPAIFCWCLSVLCSVAGFILRCLPVYGSMLAGVICHRLPFF
jgi:hypothetical protein